MPTIQGILETALYVSDLDRAEAFYRDLFAFTRLRRDDRLCALRVPAGATGAYQVLLLFLKEGTLEGSDTPFGFIPPHDGDGQLHMAYCIGAEEVPAWQARLREKGIEVESVVRWGKNTSLYFRDPDSHLIELATPGLWDETEAK